MNMNENHPLYVLVDTQTLKRNANSAARSETPARAEPGSAVMHLHATAMSSHFHNPPNTSFLSQPAQ